MLLLSSASLNTRRGKTKEQNIIQNSRMANRTTVSTSFQPGSLPGLLTTVAPAVITSIPAVKLDQIRKDERRQRGEMEKEKEREGGTGGEGRRDGEESSVAVS